MKKLLSVYCICIALASAGCYKDDDQGPTPPITNNPVDTTSPHNSDLFTQLLPKTWQLKGERDYWGMGRLDSTIVLPDTSITVTKAGDTSINVWNTRLMYFPYASHGDTVIAYSSDGRPDNYTSLYYYRATGIIRLHIREGGIGYYRSTLYTNE